MTIKIDKKKLPDLLLEANQDWMIHPIEYKVYSYLCCKSVIENLTYIDISIKVLASKLNHSQSSIVNAIKELESNQYIETHHRTGQKGRYSVVGLTGFLREESKEKNSKMDDLLSHVVEE
ncbi:MAG: hypothetical protein HQM12_15470 [SAR324 cluster bacterium]|nr:hypothetical protein [SAR324 cluster bacterium]MBF0352340.1 hypothetical protein [SAR324 cluster bacterium]